MKQPNISGVFPALLTPFTKGGKSVDYDKACALAEHLAAKKVDGLFIGGTTGEGLLMTLDERKRLAEETIAAVGKKVTIIVHSGCLDANSAVELTRHAAEQGAAACAAMAPAFYRFDDKAMAVHFKTIAKAAPNFPLMLYNIPGCTHNPLSPAFIIGMAREVENIVGVKDSGGRMQDLNVLLADRPKGFIVFNGVDEYSAQALTTGADGSVASTANVVPGLFNSIYDAAKKGDFKAAWKHQKTLSQACGHFHYGAMVAYYKEGLRLLGVDAGYCRPPQRELTNGEKKSLAEGLASLGII